MPAAAAVMMHPPVDFTRFYTDAYSLSDAAQAEHYGRWRELGARSKADHVVELARRAGVRPRTLVEIGCGAGDLLAQLFARGIAERQDGFELSAPAAEIARSHGIPQTRIEVFDGARVPASDGAYDLAVVSHVLEHVPDPASLLAEAVRVARWVLVEVPLEANRSAARPAKRAAAATIGHIQFFDRAAVRALCAGAGLEIRAELGDPLSYSHHAFHARGTRGRARAAAKAVARRLAWRAAPRIAERSFTVHYACIATADGAA